MNIVILAGGVGTRLWPLGRKNNPKQFFPIVSEQPLIKETYNRFAKTYGLARLFFSVTEDLALALRRLFPRVPATQFIVEPSRRDTAPAMGFVAARLFAVAPDEPLAFVPADHVITDPKKYLACFRLAERLIKKTGKLLDIGIRATFPSTVLGYTKIGPHYGAFGGLSVFRFAGHTEKPDLSAATRYLASGRYLWHGNYYMWTPRQFLAAFARYAPTHYRALEQLAKSPKLAAARRRQLYAKLPKISFDYAITEKIARRDVLIIEGNFGWGDVGAWDVLHEQLRPRLADRHGNVLKGQVVHLDTHNCLLYTHPRKILAAVGLKDAVVIDTPDALLVCPKHRAQEVKKLFPEIEQRGLTRHL